MAVWFLKKLYVALFGTANIGLELRKVLDIAKVTLTLVSPRHDTVCQFSYTRIDVNAVVTTWDHFLTVSFTQNVESLVIKFFVILVTVELCNFLKVVCP